MGLDRGVADKHFAMEGRHDEGGILSMGASAVWPVVEDDIAGFEDLDPADTLDGFFDAEIHGAHEHWRTGCLGQHADFGIIDRRREIEDLVDHWRERRADKCLHHLFGCRIQCVAHDFRGDRIGIGDAAGAAETGSGDDWRSVVHGDHPAASAKRHPDLSSLAANPASR